MKLPTTWREFVWIVCRRVTRPYDWEVDGD